MKASSSRLAARWLALATAAAILPACSVLQPVKVGQDMVGAPQAAVQARFGTPTDTYQLADGTQRWIYSKQPFGQQSYAADFDRDGHLSTFRQMLQTSELYKAKVDVWTKLDVEQHFGKPREPKQYYPLMKREVWSYRFRHEDTWPSMFNFYFDDAGVLRQTQITPDPLAEGRGRRR
ncbi:hypothetical protein [Cupriavidus basilensis]|uniref:Putative lipoprotein transmembrane n=1 Tax=Cupriavidus basilensis TaxID=68895 RepID=A0A0C4Y0R6_9BURK|nr:hypothetical protein [Cupriavidus basilensis]AJG18537.1 putative lipoprotein transmembrane [Cupriavidus basilensis]